MSTLQEAIVPEFQRHHRLALAIEWQDVDVKEMASILGVTPATVYNYMNGSRAPKLAAVKIWAARCGVPWQWLEYGAVPPQDPQGGEPPTIWYKPHPRPLSVVAIAA